MIRARKFLITMLTAILLLQPVDGLVLGQRLLGGEGLRTERTEEWPDALVVPPLEVGHQREGGHKGLAALLAGVRPAAAVDAHVGAQRRLLVEGLAAGVADEGPVARVNAQVVVQLEGLLEGFATHGTGELSRARGFFAAGWHRLARTVGFEKFFVGKADSTINALKLVPGSIKLFSR